jgi:putative MATE family efflux protein
MKEAINFKEQPVGSLILKLSLPALFAIVMNLLYGFVDGIFIGQGIGSHALGGVTIVFPLTIILISFSSLVGEGLGSIVSRGIAGGKDKIVSDTIRTGQGMTFWLSMLFIITSFFFIEKIMIFLGATPDILDYAVRYYRALLFGLPFMGLSLVYFHQLNAQGEIRVAMKAMVLSTLINIIFDYAAIFIFDMGIEGAGFATAFSQLIWYFYMHINACKSQTIKTVIHPVTLKLNITRAVEIIQLGFSSFVRQIGVSIALILINSLAGKYGTSHHIIAFGTAQRIFRLLIAPIAALSMAIKPIVGQNYGFGEYKRIRLSLNYAFQISIIIGTVLLAILYILREVLGNIFGIASDQMEVFVRILLLTSILFPIYGVHHITVSYFTALGKAKQALLLNLLKQVIFLIPLIFILSGIFGVYGLFMALPMADLLTIGISIYMFRRDISKLGVEDIYAVEHSHV